jgi:putative SOS response-associated peptidase YedK
MCGRYTLTSQEGLVEDLEAALDPEAPKNQWWKPRFNIAPTQAAPVVTLREGHRVIEMMRWGLVPFWASKPGSKPPLMINARVESIESNRIFRDALERKRCLVPADGFFEWLQQGKHKQPIWLHPQPHRFIAFAGLWARAKTATGETHSFTIVTGPPNELAKAFHDRMPIVLDRNAWSEWLDPTLDPKRARALLTIPDPTGWVAEAVSPWVNKADHDDAKCIEPISPPAPVQGSLFGK